MNNLMPLKGYEREALMNGPWECSICETMQPQSETAFQYTDTFVGVPRPKFWLCHKCNRKQRRGSEKVAAELIKVAKLLEGGTMGFNFVKKNVTKQFQDMAKNTGGSGHYERGPIDKALDKIQDWWEDRRDKKIEESGGKDKEWTPAEWDTYKWKHPNTKIHPKMKKVAAELIKVAKLLSSNRTT